MLDFWIFIREFEMSYSSWSQILVDFKSDDINAADYGLTAVWLVTFSIMAFGWDGIALCYANTTFSVQRKNICYLDQASLELLYMFFAKYCSV